MKLYFQKINIYTEAKNERMKEAKWIEVRENKRNEITKINKRINVGNHKDSQPKKKVCRLPNILQILEMCSCVEERT